MIIEPRSRRLRCLCLAAAAALAFGAARGASDQKPTAAQLKAKRSSLPNAARESVLCTDCARLSVHITSIGNDACPACNDFREHFGLAAFIDPYFLIINHGDLASNPGTLTVEWRNLRPGDIVKKVFAVPAIPPDGEEFIENSVSGQDGILFMAGEGVTLTLDYSDAKGTRHKVRKVTRCPDK